MVKKNLVLSQIHSSFKKLFTRGKTRKIIEPLKAIFILEAKLSKTETESTKRISQERAKNEYGLESSAPTGHKSIILPNNKSL